MPGTRIFRRRTKIVCTIGPATSSMATLERLIMVGMNVSRFNLSHGTHAEHERYIQSIRKISRRLGVLVAILIDLPGPKYRIGDLKGGTAELKRGARVTLTIRQVEGDSGLLPVNLPTLSQDVKAGDTVLLDDGAMRLKVLVVEGEEVKCRVIAGGTITKGRGLAVPGMKTSGPFITDSFKDHLSFCLEQKPDFIAVSFVSSVQDIEETRALLHAGNVDIPLIAKIERGTAVNGFDAILAASDGIMVARGDLGVDIPLEKIPMVQKSIIRRCNKAGKVVITATQMLESMIQSASPTRAEVTDVANSIFDGTDAMMLSGETSIGKHPVQAVVTMDKIARETEKKLPYGSILATRGKWIERQTDELISYSACYTAHSLGAAAIVAYTQSGSTPGRLAKYRPRVPILALTPCEEVCGKLMLHWGVYPLFIDSPSTVDELFSLAGRLSREVKIAKSGDLIIVTGGVPVGVAGSTNLLKVEKIGEAPQPTLVC
ncbi:MAG: pyruvate kinase [Dehalococcoidia bacterium]|nr:pyruvate kinase [Dehalococcoidia bacterium]MDZ4247499.1 pyruvate kinase [Dehalococcoidia bacterium]